MTNKEKFQALVDSKKGQITTAPATTSKNKEDFLKLVVNNQESKLGKAPKYAAESRDQRVRKSYAAKHPETTGGEAGQLARDVRSSQVKTGGYTDYLNNAGSLLSNYSTLIQNAQQAYASNPNENNYNYLDELINKHNSLADEYNAAFDRYEVENASANDAIERYKEYYGVEASDARLNEIRPLRDEAKREWQELSTLETEGATPVGIYKYGSAAEAEDAYRKYEKQYNDELVFVNAKARGAEATEKVKGDAKYSATYDEAKKLKSDMDKIAAVANDALYHNGGSEIEEYKAYLLSEYGLTQEAINSLVGGGTNYLYDESTDGYSSPWQLYNELEARLNDLSSQLSEGGYNYKQMANYEQTLLDAAEYAVKKAEQEQYAKEHPLFASIASVVASPFQGIDYANTMMRGIGTSDVDSPETYIPMNVYNMDITNYVNTLRQTVAGDIEEDWGKWGKVGSFLYNTGMSIADSAVQVAALGKASILFMGASAASNQAREVIQNGGTNEQAFWSGLAAGAAEALFEKFSVENLLDPNKSLKQFKSFLKETAKQAGIEGSEELFTELANILSNAAIMGNNSNFAKAVENYMTTEHMTEAEAKKKAYLDLVGQAGLSTLAGVLSGGVMGGFVNFVGYRRAKKAAPVLDVKPSAEYNNGMPDDEYQNRVVAFNKMNEEYTKRYNAARESGEDVSNEEMKWLISMNTTLAKEHEVLAKEKKRREGIANETNDSNITEGIDYGTAEIHLRDSGERSGSENTSGQISAVEESTGRDQSWQEESRPADRESASLTYGEEVSTASLGIKGGSNNKNIRLVTDGETTATKRAREAAKERGLRLVLFGGGTLDVRQKRIDGTFENVKANAAIIGDRLFIRADHPVYTSDQFARHEVAHDKVNKGEIDPNAVRERLISEHGIEDFDRVASLYEAAYADTGLSPEKIWVEVICDSEGDMNIFSRVFNDKQAESAVGEYIPKVKKAATDTKTTGAKTSPTVAEFSREVNENETRLEERSRAAQTSGDRRQTENGERPRVSEESGGNRREVQNALVGVREKRKVTADAAEYDVPITFAKAEDWPTQHKDDPAYTSDGRFYVKEDFPIELTEQLIPHEAAHAMRQANFPPYMDFVARAPDMLNATTSAGRRLLSGAAKHRGIDLFGELSERQIDVLYDEVNALVSGVAIGDAEGTILEDLYEAFYDYDAYKAELKDIHQQFKNRNANEAETTPDYSRELETLKELREQNEALKEKAEYWKNQTKRTTSDKVSLRKNDVEKLAKRLLKDYSSKLEANDIADELVKLGEFILRGGDDKNELTWSEVKDRAVDIARDVVQNAERLNDDMYRAYSDMRSYLRSTTLVYGKELHGDIADFEDFRRSNFGRLNIKSKGRTNIDVIYEELADSWSGFFNSDVHSHPTDQLLHIVDVLDSLRPVYENPFSYDMATAIEYVANDIVDSLLSEDIRQMPPTFADRQAAKLDAQKAKDAQRLVQLREKKNARIAEIRQQGKKRIEEAVRREQKKRNSDIKKLKEHYREVARLRSENRADSAARTRLLKIARRLHNKKLPAANRQLLNQYIGELDIIAKSMTDKTLNKLTELRDWYENERDNNPDFISDPRIEKSLSRLSKKQIQDLSADEVAELTNVLLNIENELKNSKKLIDSAEKREVYAMGIQTITDVQNSKGSKEGWRGIPDKYITTETLSPVRQIHRLTGYVDNDPLYVLTNELADGQRKMFDFQRKAGDLFLRWTKDQKFVDSIAGKNAQEIEIAGIGSDGPVKVKITPAMRMSLYLHSKNDQNLQHIAGGGVTIPDMKLYKQGKIAEAYARGTTIKLKPSEVNAITARMTDKERAFALAAHGYFNGMSQASINEVSEKLKGYSLAQVEDYFPINTDTSFTKKEFDALKFDGTIEGMGFLKERVNSSSPIMLRDMNDVLKQSVDSTAKYVGLAIPVRNFNKVWGVTKASFDEKGNRTNYESSVQQAIKKKWGEDGYKYVENMMTDLNSGRSAQDSWAKVLNKVKSNYAGAVLTLNLSVAMKQAASYPTAGAVIGFKPLAKAMKNFNKVDLELINKYTPLLWYRTQGFSTQELGDMAKRNKSLPKVLNWVQGVDVITTRTLWKAAEYYVRDTNKALKHGSDEYYRAVADVYNRIIEETQPNYTTMQRPQLLRSENSLMQNLSMFKTQPFQNFNILYDAMGNLDAKKTAYINTGTAEAKSAFEDAKKSAVWAITSQIMQLAVFAGMTFAWNMFRGKRDKYEDEDEEMTLMSALAGISKDMIGGAFSNVPFGSDVWELLSSKVFGDQYYGMDAVTVAALTDAVKAVSDMTSLVFDTAKAMASDEPGTDWNEVRLKADGYIDDMSKLLGIPYENVANLFNAVFMHTAKAIKGKYLGEYATLKLTSNKESDYFDLLYKSMTNDRDAYEFIYADMVANGIDPKKISTNMENRMKKEQGVTKVEDLNERYLSPSQEKTADRIREDAAGSSVWKKANATQRKEFEDNLWNLASESEYGQKMQKVIDGGAYYGINESDYLLYKLALDMCDKPNKSGKLGTYTNEEVENAIEMLKLGDAASSYLWIAQGNSEKNNPWA